MRVINQNLSGTSASEASRAEDAQKTGRAEANTKAAAGSGDRVELSSTLSSLSRALSAYSNDRASRVQELAAQYQSGSHRPDSAATSRAMVSEALAGAAAR